MTPTNSARVRADLQVKSCAECAYVFGSCCHHPRIMLSYSEMNQIIGPCPEDYLTLIPYNGVGDWDPDWRYRVHTIERKKFELCRKRVNNICCPDLTPTGCSDLRVKPLICRLWPFWVIGGEVVYDQDPHFCPLSRLPIEKSLSILGETKESIKKCHAEFMMDAKEHATKLNDIAIKIHMRGHCD